MGSSARDQFRLWVGVWKLMLPASPVPPALGNLRSQISAALFTVMRLLARVEAVRDLAAALICVSSIS